MAKMYSWTKRKSGTIYKYVSEVVNNGKDVKYRIGVLGVQKQFDTLKEAAIEVDKILILNGKNPVNILKPKPKE
jgi:hypothetical protein